MQAPVQEEEIARAAALVRKHFGHANLRPGQGETLARVLRGESVLAVLPTGSGKSILYQLPGLLSRGVTLVVSPLLALMKDQLDGLPPPMRAATVAVTSEMDPREVREALAEIAQGRYRLVYAAPERLRQAEFVEAARRGGVSRLVVDEAHCISFWGHDFRPDYLLLGDVRKLLGDPPVLALTATAPPPVRDEIARRLGTRSVVAEPVDRPNLRLETIHARDADEKLAHLLHLVRGEPGSTLVYAGSRAKCETLASALAGAGLAADWYHAGAEDRPARQERFMRGEIRVLVATVAFGMGVDKDDVRLLVHFDPPGSLEAYWQEAGRAGRDGKPARCVLLATSSDASTLAQRARSDVPPPSLLEGARLLAQSSRERDGYALVPARELAALDADPARARVALNLLCEAGFAERLGDVPGGYVVHAEAGPLAPLAGKEASAFAVAEALSAKVEDVPALLLAEAAAGNLRYGARTPDVLLRLRDESVDAARAIERARRAAEERTRAVVAYGRGRTCRHAAIARHFGDAPGPVPCGACDVCLRVDHALPAEAAPDDAKAAREILRALASVRGIGLANLALLLRGDPSTPPWAARSPAFGALALRSESAVKALARRLVERGLVGRETLGHGGESVHLTEAGRRALDSGERFEPEPDRAAVSAPRPAPAEVAAGDRPLYEALRTWRADLARRAGVPAYVVAPDRVLAAIALHRPQDAASLLSVPGIGPKKLETFGEDILRIVAEHER